MWLNRLEIHADDFRDALMINATLNCLPGLVRSRQTIANKIIDVVLGFNPAQQTTATMTPSTRVKVKSMERTARALMINIMKKYGHLPLCKTELTGQESESSSYQQDAGLRRSPNAVPHGYHR